jgi:DNA-binding CsgD family transcriptional regulator
MRAISASTRRTGRQGWAQVAELPRSGLEVAVDVGRIASGPGSAADRATALLVALRRVVPFQAAGIYLMDPERRGQVPVVSEGYDEAVSQYILSPAVADEIELLGFDHRTDALRICDMPVPREQIHGWVKYLSPAGFQEGLGVGLFARDGRHLGILGLNTDTDRHPTEAARDLITMLAPTIANAVDPLRSIATVSAIVEGAEAGIVVTRSGTTEPLPGLPAHPLLGEGSGVLALASERLAAGRVYSSFLCPYSATDAGVGMVLITMLACPSDAPYNLVAVVLVSPPNDLRGLTRRELEILGLLVEGWSNFRIATAMVVARRTVNSHLEHILAKLGAPSRTLAAVRALRFGLYVPRPLNGVP